MSNARVKNFEPSSSRGEQIAHDLRIDPKRRVVFLRKGLAGLAAIVGLTLASGGFLMLAPSAEAHRLGLDGARHAADDYMTRSAERQEALAEGTNYEKSVIGFLDSCRRVNAHVVDCSVHYQTSLFFSSSRVDRTCEDVIRVRFDGFNRRARTYSPFDDVCSESPFSN